MQTMFEGEQTEWHETTESFDKGKHGKDYEIEISKFVFKRLVDANFKNFKFTREKKGLGKFDDLTYIHETEDGRKKFGLIQLKHILDGERKIGYEALAKDKNSYFLLSEYFDYYLESLNAISTDKDFDDTELEALIICTNIGLEEDLQTIQKRQIDNDGIFKNSGILYKFEIPNDVKRKIFAENYLTASKRLANELMFCLMLNKHVDITCLKKHDHVSMIKNYHAALANYVIDPCTKKFKTEFLEADVNEPSEVRKFRHYFFESISEFYKDYKDLSGEELKTKFGIGMKTSEKVGNRISDFESTKSVEEFLKKQLMSVSASFGKVSLYPFDFKTLPAEEDIVIDEMDKKIDDFLKLLIFASEEHGKEAIIRDEMSSDIFIAYNDKMNRWYHTGSYEDSAVRKRNWITKKKLLSEAMESTIKFQGRTIRLNQLVCNESLLDPDILLRTFCSKEITVGRKVSDLGDIKNYYIFRVLSQQRAIDKNVLKTSENDVFIVSNVNDSQSKQDLIKHLPNQAILKDIISFDGKSRFVSAESGFQETHFKEFIKNRSKNFCGKNVHWLKYDGRQLLWQNTYGSLSELQTHFYKNTENTEFLDEWDVSNTRRFIIISGEPGMGKSTLFKNVTQNITKDEETKEKPSWIIKILLKDCADVFENIANCKDLENIADFLAYFENTDDDFSKNLLKCILMNENRIILMLDGFDELYSTVEQEKIIELLNFLKYKSTIKQIWITTRPHYKEILENCLGVVSFSMKEIDEEEQISFLSRYWKYNSSQNEEKMLKCAKELIKNINANINNQERSFLGIPLQTYLFAVGFLEEVLKDEPIIPETLPITSLFERFLQTKYSIYFQKSGDNTFIKEKKQQFLRKVLDVVHQDFALRYGGLLSLSEAELFDRRNHTFEDDELLDIGIVYKVKDQYHFVHRTFSEYLTAKRLVEVSLECHKFKTECIDFLKRIVLQPENEFLRYLFDLKLSEKFPLHHFALNGDETKVRNFNDDEINAEDCLGRRPLYYALQYRHSNIINILIEKGTFVDVKDKFLIKALTSFAGYYYPIHFPFLPSSEGEAKLSCHKDSLQTQEFKMLHFTHKNLAEHIFKSNVLDYPVELFDVYKLYLEIYFKNWRVVELLIKRGCEIRTIKPLIDLFKYEAPLEIVTLLINRIRNNEITSKSKIQTDFYLDFGYIAKYLLKCKTNDITHLSQEYTDEATDLINKFNVHLRDLVKNLSLLGISSDVSFLTKYMPLKLLLDNYYDLSSVYSNETLSSLLDSVKRRSNNLTIIVNSLFVCKVQCCGDHKKNDVILPDLVPALRSIGWRTTVGSLKERVGTDVIDSCPETESITEVWSTIKDYQEEFHFDTNTVLEEAIRQILLFVLNSSGAWELIDLFSEFHVVVKTNDVDGLTNCLLKAEEHGWVKALLNACNSDFEMAEDVAHRKGFTTILEIIATYREKSIELQGILQK